MDSARRALRSEKAVAAVQRKDKGCGWEGRGRVSIGVSVLEVPEGFLSLQTLLSENQT